MLLVSKISDMKSVFQHICKPIICLAIGLITLVLVAAIGHYHNQQTESQRRQSANAVSTALSDLRSSLYKNIKRDRINGNLVNLSGLMDPKTGLLDSSKVGDVVKSLWEKSNLDVVEAKVYDSVLTSEPDSIDTNPNTIYVVSNNWEIVFECENNIGHLMNNNPDEKVRTPLWIPFSNGKAEGTPIFANFGTSKDFQILSDAGIDIKGKIVILITNEFVGHPITEVVKRGVAGIILFSLPYGGLQEYLKTTGGSANSPAMFQTPLSEFGDPLTLGYTSKYYINNSFSYKEQIDSLNLNAQVQQIVFSDAIKLLQFVDNKTIPKQWKTKYSSIFNSSKSSNQFQTNDARILIQTTNKILRKPIRNIIGYFIGGTNPDEYIIIGAAQNPASTDFRSNGASLNTACLLEIVSAFSQQRSLGWRPRRTLVFASWDAEEFGLFGSTEWLEEFAELNRVQTLAYLNLNIRQVSLESRAGLRLKAMPILWELIQKTVESMPIKEKRKIFPTHASGSSAHEDIEILAPFPTLGYPTGLVDDYLNFASIAGVPVLNIGFGTYWNDVGDDNIEPLIKFTMSLISSLGERPILPMNLSHYSYFISNAINSTLLPLLSEINLDLNYELRHLAKCCKRFERSAERFDTLRAAGTTANAGTYVDEVFVAQINARLLRFERLFVAKDKLNRRSKHLIFGQTFFPLVQSGIRSYLESYNPDSQKQASNEIRHQINEIQRTLESAISWLSIKKPKILDSDDYDY